jgi:hypothetical protein
MGQIIYSARGIKGDRVINRNKKRAGLVIE